MALWVPCSSLAEWVSGSLPQDFWSITIGRTYTSGQVPRILLSARSEHKRQISLPIDQMLRVDPYLLQRMSSCPVQPATDLRYRFVRGIDRCFAALTEVCH